MIIDPNAANSNSNKAKPAHSGPYIFDVDTQDFEDRVINASMERPVLVDFWAPWCGPCKQLIPTLEKLVTAAGGEIFLAKVNLDENQQLAGMLRVQSVPTVYVFFGGRPIDAFQGVVPESQLQQFINKAIQVARQSRPDAIDIPETLSAAVQALAEFDLAAAQALYAQILQQDPNHAQAFAGMVRVFIAAGDLEHAAHMMEQAPDVIQKSSAYAEVKSALELANNAPDGEATEFEAALAKDENDHQARLDLAVHQFASGAKEKAMENLLTIIAKDREWNDQAARAQLLKFFEALGHADPLTVQARKRLSSLLFS